MKSVEFWAEYCLEGSLNESGSNIDVFWRAIRGVVAEGFCIRALVVLDTSTNDAGWADERSQCVLSAALRVDGILLRRSILVP